MIEDNKQGVIHIDLKYGPRARRSSTSSSAESKPGRRLYYEGRGHPEPVQGLGISVVSTSRGVMSDRQAAEKRVGGELLCTVF